MNFWQDRSVVVTGGAGFLGARVVDQVRSVGGLTSTFLARRTAISAIETGE
jgi:nucleoside-diphosphate-sugar epimerase